MHKGQDQVNIVEVYVRECKLTVLSWPYFLRRVDPVHQ